MPADIQSDAISDFAAKLTGMLKQHGRDGVVEVQRGKRYARIAFNGSAYAFVEIATGAIYKPDGWRAPAKHARGNINDPNPLACCGPYGVAYLRN